VSTISKSEQEIMRATENGGTFYGVLRGTHGWRLINAARRLEEAGTVRFSHRRVCDDGATRYELVRAPTVGAAR
jgi:hypothetical protein